MTSDRASDSSIPSSGVYFLIYCKPRIGDFGQTRFFPEDQTYLSTAFAGHCKLLPSLLLLLLGQTQILKHRDQTQILKHKHSSSLLLLGQIKQVEEEIQLNSIRYVHEIMESNEVIAPFVMKTYQMVNDSSLDNLIRWGTCNNSFIVVDSLDFSQRLLPAYFKHNNFSSFIRQLNTYGFRKVDPDRWEFANEWFLRGQVHLLKNIGRKKQGNSRGKYSANMRGEDEDEEEMVMEIARLKQEQKALEEELIGMNKRLEVTERRPEQMMALLCKVAEDPEILSRMMLEKVQRSKRLVDKKRQRRLITPPPPLPSSSSIGISNSIKREEDECYQMSNGRIVSSPEGYYGNEPLWTSPPSPVTPSTVWPWTKDTCGGVGDDGAGFSMESEPMNGFSRYATAIGVGGGDTLYFGDGSADPEVRPPPPYPFSLLGGGF